MILGIDEVGRGPWAGPLVVGAVVLPTDHTLQGLTDSKKLTKRQRERLAPEIMKQAQDYALGWVRADELDEIGMTEALKLATRRAVEQITCPYHEIIIDGTINFLADTSKGQYVTTLKKADLLIAAVSAASIIAKVARDDYMTEQADIYPAYGFERHAGYGTAVHRQAIKQHGVTPLHRLSFAPLASYRTDKKSKQDTQPKSRKTTTKHLGDEAEHAVARYLTRHGHTVLERNWRTKFCEIDIISMKDDSIYFTEVKYRKNDEYGDGLEAITKKKLRQMTFAAEYYQTKHAIDKTPLLAAASVAGESATIQTWMVLTSNTR